MELNKIVEVLNAKQKGTFIRIGWETEIQSKKAEKQGILVLKKTITTVRWGCRYDNLKSVKEARGDKPIEHNRNVWFKHMSGNPYVVEHISDSSKKYLQLFTVNKRNLTKTEYYINGRIATKQEVENSGYVNPSAIAGGEKPVVMNIPIANIKFIGKEVM